MALERLTAGGIRGLSTAQTVEFAQPDGINAGSGLTVLVGTNNSGKSTIIEALRAVGSDSEPSFSEGKRNKSFGDKIFIRAEFDHGKFRQLESIRPSSSQTRRIDGSNEFDLAVVPSRRNFNAYFADPGRPLTRAYYMRSTSIPVQRGEALGNFAYRLIELEKDDHQRARFNELLEVVLGYKPNWTIDQNDRGDSYLRFVWTSSDGSSQAHSSDGLGEGLISLIVILDALRDSQPGSCIVVDEPELSLHPQFQRRLQGLLGKLTKDRQIIYATHSPYFVNWADVANGSVICRIHKSALGTTVSTPTRSTIDSFIRLGRGNINNPHILGLDANEVFFLEGGVVLTEGQEDVVLLPTVVNQLLDRTPSWSYFGWGVGGAENMAVVARLLEELGYTTVVGVLDNDKSELRAKLAVEFPTYHFECIPASDIRFKSPRPATIAKPAKEGLIDGSGVLKSEHVAEMTALTARMQAYFTENSTSIL